MKIALAIAALGAVFCCPAVAHQAPSGWAYPLDCCGDHDCEPVAANNVGESERGFVIGTSGEFVFRRDARLSGDGGYHVCRKPDGSIRCFFYPPRGM